MFFLLRFTAAIAIIYTYSPVQNERQMIDREMVQREVVERGTETLAGLLDESQYENWAALPQYARDRLTMEIARQLADSAAARDQGGAPYR